MYANVYTILGIKGCPVFKPNPLWILYGCFFSTAAACRVSTWTYLHIHLLLLAGQVEGSQHAIVSSCPNHFVRLIHLHRPVQRRVLLPSQIREGPVADTNSVAKWIAATKTFSFEDGQLVKCGRRLSSGVHHKNRSELQTKVLISRKKQKKPPRDSPTYCAFATHTTPKRLEICTWMQVLSTTALV